MTGTNIKVPPQPAGMTTINQLPDRSTKHNHHKHDQQNLKATGRTKSFQQGPAQKREINCPSTTDKNKSRAARPTKVNRDRYVRQQKPQLTRPKKTATHMHDKLLGNKQQNIDCDQPPTQITRHRLE